MNPVFREVKYIPGIRGRFKKIPPIYQNESVNDWKIKRDKILYRLEHALGGLPPAVPATAEIDSTEDMSGLIRHHLKIKSKDQDEITAYLLIPENVPTTGKYKTILALHETCYQGKDEAAGIKGYPNFFYGLELAKQGYMVLIPDVEAAGERVKPGEIPYVTNDFHKRYPNWSYMGKMLYDHRQCIDYLYGRDDVDKTGIGVIGHSKGGYNALFLAAFDRRVKTLVSSCGYQPVTGEKDKKRWVRKGYEHFKPVNECVSKYNYYPFEFHEVLACIAPRACFIWYTKYDRCFPDYKGVEKLNRLVTPVYELYGKGSLFVNVLGSEGHDFPSYAREAAYRFINCNL